MSWLERLQKAKAVPDLSVTSRTRDLCDREPPEPHPSRAANDAQFPALASAVQVAVGVTVTESGQATQTPALVSDGCWPHGEAWNTVEVDCFHGRMAAFTGQGVDLAQSEALAQKLVYRDREGDDRRLCLECAHLHRLNGGHCANGQRAGVSIRASDAHLGCEFVMRLQRCDGFTCRGLQG